MVSPSKRERAYARRRHDEWLERRRKREAARRRRLLVAGSVVGVAVLATAVTAIVLATRPDAPIPEPSTAAYEEPPSPELAQGRAWPVTLQTDLGAIDIELDGAAAPQAVSSFLMLARDGFFDGSTCHRLVVGALLQCGDPTGSGAGGPGYTFGPIENAPEDQTYPAGTVAMGRAPGDAESQGSQFFIVFQDTVLPDDEAGGYTVFGRVTDGLDVLTQVDAGGTVDGGQDGAPAVPVMIEGVVIP